MGVEYKNSKGGYTELRVKGRDTLPKGAIIGYEGTDIPEGYEVIEEEKKLYVIHPPAQTLQANTQTSVASLILPAGKYIIHAFFRFYGANNNCQFILLNNGLQQSNKKGNSASLTDYDMELTTMLETNVNTTIDLNVVSSLTSAVYADPRFFGLQAMKID